MADDAPEGWQVPQRRAMIAAILAPVTLLVVVVGAGWLYEHGIKGQRPSVTPFPAPGIESYVHDGVRDPERPAPRAQHDARIGAAKRAIVADGWPR